VCASETQAPPKLTITDRLNGFGRALSVSELAHILNIAPLTLLRWVKAKRVPFFRLGRTIRFCPATISRWLQARETVPAWFRTEAAA
jgi:excisionase family DNA binding protein